MLILPIKKKWFDMIVYSREKKEEYREIKPYWTKRIMKWLNIEESSARNLHDMLRRVKLGCKEAVVLQNGYAKNAPRAKVAVSLSIGEGRKEWGAEEGKEYYRFHIEKVLSGDRRVDNFIESAEDQLCDFCNLSEECPKGMTCYGGQPVEPQCTASGLSEPWIEEHIDKEAILEYLDGLEE